MGDKRRTCTRAQRCDNCRVSEITAKFRFHELIRRQFTSPERAELTRLALKAMLPPTDK